MRSRGSGCWWTSGISSSVHQWFWTSAPRLRHSGQVHQKRPWRRLLGQGAPSALSHGPLPPLCATLHPRPSPWRPECVKATRAAVADTTSDRSACHGCAPVRKLWPLGQQLALLRATPRSLAQHLSPPSWGWVHQRSRTLPLSTHQPCVRMAPPDLRSSPGDSKPAAHGRSLASVALSRVSLASR